MAKLLLIDGNSMLFRAYYGTLSRGLMKSGSGVVTNAVFGFSTMLHKAVEMIAPDYILVAFDTHVKTFRHEVFTDYKGTRKEVDPELVSQFALVREFLDAHHITRLEVEGYEADDVIGTLAAKHKDLQIDVLTSDRDMLQLIDDHVDILLMKKGLTDIKIMNKAALYEEMEIQPSQIVDLKSLMGDSSDNIPGVPSVGEKTALKLIHQYETLEGVYEHQDAIKGKLGEKIREYKEQAYLSYYLAKINCEVPLTIDLETLKAVLPTDALNAFYRKYDMNSLIVDDFNTETARKDEITLSEFDASWLNQPLALVSDVDKNEVLRGIAISDGQKHAYLSLAEMSQDPAFHELLLSDQLIVSSTKPLYRFALEAGLDTVMFDDLMLLAFITDPSITTLARLKDEFQLWFYEYEGLENHAVFAGAMFALFEKLKEQADADGSLSVYHDVEKPLSPILAKCEYYGIKVDVKVLNDIAEKTHGKINELSALIFEHAGKEFNINSPKQLAEVLFDDLKLPTKKKRSTAVDVLEGLAGVHPIVKPLLEYRKYQKLYSTYAVGLVKHIARDGRIHTQFNQHATQTGRLSSSNPNLQNISVRDEETKEIRRAFVASEGCVLLSIDYSQIELRVLSYLADEAKMMEAFNHNQDIHTETARDIFKENVVTPIMRRQAKSVNFGIVYGISEFGLAKQLDISNIEARHFMQRYHEVYPQIRQYMDRIVAECERDGYVTTYFGRRRYIPEIHDKNRAVKEFGKRAAMNAPIQGTAADIIKLAMIRADQALKDHHFKTKMLLQVHDELVFEVPHDEVDAVREAMESIMEAVVAWPVALEVSTSVGKDWFDK